MSSEKQKELSVIPMLTRALQRIRTTPPRVIASPPTQPRRAAVAIIIRLVPLAGGPPAMDQIPPLPEFLEQDWVKSSRAEVLFLRRQAGEDGLNSTSPRNTSDAHLAFPGGRMEDGDEGGMYTAMRQTWEEIGIDLAEREYMFIGQLDDREITTALGKRLLMVLSPFVFLQISPAAPPADPTPSTTLHWTPLATLVSQSQSKWSTVTVDAASRLAPRHAIFLRYVVRALVGSMQFPAIIIHAPTPSKSLQLEEKGAHTEQLKLWGLSLGMTLDLMAYMFPPSSPDSPLRMQLPHPITTPEGTVMRVEVVAPSLASVFPHFSYPDVNFWIWVFGKRYRAVVRGWEASVRTAGTNDRRINWSGTALNTFYAAVRKALVVVIIARALGIIFGLALAGWWVFYV